MKVQAYMIYTRVRRFIAIKNAIFLFLFARVVSKKNKTPSRRKSQARKKVFDGKTSSDWNVVVNKRKILKIKRQRAGMHR